MQKKIIILSILIFLFYKIHSQEYYPLGGNNPKKTIKYYKECFGESYIDSMYSYSGWIASYKRVQNNILDIGLNIYDLYLAGHSPENKYPKKVALRDKSRISYKIPLSVHKLELYDVALPLSFDLSLNRHALKQLLIYGFAEKKDTLLLDFSDFDSLEYFYFIYMEDREPPYIKLCLPPNLKIFQSNIPASHIPSLPESLEELYIRRDSIYPFSIDLLPNLWVVSFYGQGLYLLSEELINKPSLKNIMIGDTLTFADVELLSKIPHLDTLTLVWSEEHELPDNLEKLTNVSVVKLDFNLTEMWYYPLRYSIAENIKHILPNATVVYKDVLQTNPRRIEGFIEYKQKEK